MPLTSYWNPVRFAYRHNLSPLLKRQIDRQQPVNPGRPQIRTEPVETVIQQDIVIREQHKRRFGKAFPDASGNRENLRQRRAGLQRKLSGTLDGPSAIGSENGTPSSIISAPASIRRPIRASLSAGDGQPTVT